MRLGGGGKVPGRRRLLDDVETPIFLGLLDQLDPSLGHVDQHGLGARLIGAVGQPKAFQRILAITVRSAHGVASAAMRDFERRTLIRAIRSDAAQQTFCQSVAEIPQGGDDSTKESIVE
jgi:hypothetical protein